MNSKRGDLRLHFNYSESLLKCKRSQITIFVIVAIIIIAGIIAFFFATGRLNLGLGSSEEITNLLSPCINDLALDSFYTLGLQGGYYTVKGDSISYGSFDIPVFYNKGVADFPSKNVLELELAKSIKDNLFLCNSSLNTLRAQGYEVTVGEPKSVEAVINQENTEVTVKWPISIKKEDSVETISTIRTTVNFDFQTKYNNILEFLTEQDKYPDQLLLTRMAELGNERGYIIEGQFLEGSGATMYSFIYEAETYKNQTYINSFAVIY